MLFNLMYLSVNQSVVLSGTKTHSGTSEFIYSDEFMSLDEFRHSDEFMSLDEFTHSDEFITLDSAGAIPYFWGQLLLFAFGAEKVGKRLLLLSGRW
jgi:hypothetical protein